MVSEVEFDKIFNYWWEDLKWSGVFKINWVFVKDVHHIDVHDIKVSNTSMHQLKDGSHVDFEAGKKMLEMFRTNQIDSDIFEAFEYMDEREEKLRIKRDSYYEMIKQLKSKGLIPEHMKSNNNYNGPRHNNYNKKRNSFKNNNTNRGYRHYRDSEGPNTKLGISDAKDPGHNTEYTKKKENK